MSIRARVEAAVVTTGLKVSEEGWERLDVLAGLWLHYGRALNLTGARNEADCAEQILEGLHVARCGELALGSLGKETTWLDIGSGGGFPALVVLAVQGEVDMTLVEPREKRRAFLHMASRAIGMSPLLSGARWDGSTWNQTPSDKVEDLVQRRFCILSARAVWEPGEWLRHASLIAPSATAILHLRQGMVLPGVVPLASVEGSGWLVQAVRV